MRAKFKKGYTLIELVIVISITAVLATVVSVDFQRIRVSQELANSAEEVVSRLREMQNAVLSGRVVAGAVPRAYDLVATPMSSAYRVEYVTTVSAGPPLVTSTTTLEIVTLISNVTINQVLLNSAPVNLVRIRITSPFGKVSDSASGAVNQNIQIDLVHQKTGLTKSVIVDGISGRISVQ